MVGNTAPICQNSMISFMIQVIAWTDPMKPQPQRPTGPLILLICIYAGNGTLHLKVRIKLYDAVILNKMGNTRVNKYIDPGYLCFLHHFSSSLKSLILLVFEISKQNLQVNLKLESTHSLRPLCCWSMYEYCINIFLILENKIVILLTKSDLSKMSIRGNTSLAWTPCICK